MIPYMEIDQCGPQKIKEKKVQMMTLSLSRKRRKTTPNPSKK